MSEFKHIHTENALYKCIIIIINQTQQSLIS